MPFCTQCAHAIPEGARFCPACGAAAAPAGATADPTRTSDPNALPASSSPVAVSSGMHGRFEPGTRLGTRYRIVALLGRGGMGEVYRADDLELGQSVALKFLPRARSGSAADLARFRGEVRTARQIAHPNVCRVYDIGEADGHVFISMEYIDGEDLASVLRRMGRPTPDKAVELARQICLGLAAAHEAGMLHRDLKPANVMIDGRGRARVTDFGLAGLADELAGGGEFAGTPAYMAPEQLAGGSVSVRSDLYSLGCVLYELFTGRRVFPAESLAELDRQRKSGTITTPSTHARDLDPAVERLILHCLENDPDQRPPSAYAVLGALPGGDPLAAALAAGETPSPELVANAAERGGLSPGAAMVAIALTLVGLTAWSAAIGPEFRALTRPTQVLSVRAADLLEQTGAYERLPDHSAEGFAQNQLYLAHLREDRAERAARRSAIYYWRRWSPRLIEARSIHQEMVTVNEPPGIGTGEAVVLLDPEGRLAGLRAIPPDTVAPARGGRPAWTALIAAAGFDTATIAPAAPVRPVPATCDTAAAWTASAPWLAGERVTLQAGASRGRLTHFTVVHDWGPSTADVDSLAAESAESEVWLGLLIFVLPLVASVVFATRNLRLHRGDVRGATRIAIFVFLMNLLEAAFTTRLSEVGLTGAIDDWTRGRGLGHALIHGVGMWFAYVALEPYLRSLWPRMLVGWTRLWSGRVRDPLVGREVLIGVAFGVTVFSLSVVTEYAATRFGWTAASTMVTPEMLSTLGGLANSGCQLSYAGSVCVLNVLELLLLVLVFRLLLRRTWPAVGLAGAGLAAFVAVSNVPSAGWPVALIRALAPFLGTFLLMRVGLLPGVVGMFVILVMGTSIPALDLSAWYADRALPGILAVLAIVAFGTVTALAGKSILGDPLRETGDRRRLPG